MKTVLKLVLTLLVLNAAYHIGSAYWDHYKLEDAVQEAAQFSVRAPADEIKSRVMEIAGRYEIPLQQEDVVVTKEPRKVTVDASYSRTVEIAPRYTREWAFNVHVTALTPY